MLFLTNTCAKIPFHVFKKDLMYNVRKCIQYHYTNACYIISYIIVQTSYGPGTLEAFFFYFLGYESYRNSLTGSIFIRNCIETFEKNHLDEHLEQMMIDVRASVAVQDLNQGLPVERIPQMPCTWSTLTKKFYFKPN